MCSLKGSGQESSHKGLIFLGLENSKTEGRALLKDPVCGGMGGPWVWGYTQMPGGRGLDTTTFVSGPNGIPERTEQDPWASCLAFGPRFSPDFSLLQALPTGASPAPTSPTGFGSQTLGGGYSREALLSSQVTALDGRAGSQPQADWPQVSQDCFPCTHPGPSCLFLGTPPSSETPGRESVSTEALSARMGSGS